MTYCLSSLRHTAAYAGGGSRFVPRWRRKINGSAAAAHLSCSPSLQPAPLAETITTDPTSPNGIAHVIVDGNRNSEGNGNGHDTGTDMLHNGDNNMNQMNEYMYFANNWCCCCKTARPPYPTTEAMNISHAIEARAARDGGAPNVTFMTTDNFSFTFSLGGNSSSPTTRHAIINRGLRASTTSGGAINYCERTMPQPHHNHQLCHYLDGDHNLRRSSSRLDETRGPIGLAYSGDNQTTIHGLMSHNGHHLQPEPELESEPRPPMIANTSNTCRGDGMASINGPSLSLLPSSLFRNCHLDSPTTPTPTTTATTTDNHSHYSMDDFSGKEPSSFYHVAHNKHQSVTMTHYNHKFGERLCRSGPATVHQIGHARHTAQFAQIRRYFSSKSLAPNLASLHTPSDGPISKRQPDKQQQQQQQQQQQVDSKEDKPATLTKILNDYANKHPLDKEDNQGYFNYVRQPQLVRRPRLEPAPKQAEPSDSDEAARSGDHRSLYRKSIENLQRVFMNKSSNQERSRTRFQQSHDHNHDHHQQHHHRYNDQHQNGDELDNLQPDRKAKEDGARQVMPDKKQSPISLMSQNPIYRECNRPLELHYPTTLDGLKLNNTGITWEVKLPYQQSLLTALSWGSSSHLNRYHLDQFHCHWGADNQAGSEHSVDGHLYTAELHFVHYNMDKYHSMSRAARQPDGLAVVAVFLEAHRDHLNHAELDKVANNLRLIPNKGDSVTLKQTIRLDNLLPVSNRSYWSYQGSLTTPPYYESVTWFVLKQPIKCSVAQIDKFRQIRGSYCCNNNNISMSLLRSMMNGDDSNGHKQSLSSSSDVSLSEETSLASMNSPTGSIDSTSSTYIQSNHRATQPLYGRIVYSHDETYAQARRVSRPY